MVRRVVETGTIETVSPFTQVATQTLIVTNLIFTGAILAALYWGWNTFCLKF